MEALIFIFLLLNVVSFFLFGIDKFLSRRGMRRISEKRLLMSAWAGGSIGAIAGQKLFRHKTEKFRTILWVILATQCILIVLGMWGMGMCCTEAAGKLPAYFNLAI